MLRKVFLYGDLSNKIGNVLELDVDSFHECAMALSSLFPGFKKEFSPNEYALFFDGKNIGRNEIGLILSAGDFHIIPRVFGANKIFNVGAVEFVIGAILLVASAYVGGPAWLAPLMFNAGIGFMVSGAVMMLVSGLFPDIETEAQRKSFIFSNISNSARQGDAVPLCFGRFLVGSIVVSGSLDVEDLSDDYSVTHTIS